MNIGASGSTKESAVLRVSDARLLELIRFAEKTDTRAFGLGATMDDIGLALMELSNRRAFAPEPAGRWISVKDRMPERFEVCIVAYDSDCDGKTRVCKGEITCIGSGWYVGQTDQPYTGNVTYWQPWPTFPETKGV